MKISQYKQAAGYYQESSMIKEFALNAYPYAYWLEVESMLCQLGEHKWGEKVNYAGRHYFLPKSLASANHELAKMLSDSRKDVSQKLDYWRILAPAALSLTSYFTKPGSSDVDLNIIIHGFAESWKKAGTKGKRFCEIDHCNSLEDLLSLSSNRNLKEKKNGINTIKLGLEKLV